MMNIAELMSDPDFAQAFKVLRSAAGSFAHEGEYSAGPVTELDYSGAIQPAARAALQVLPEGLRGETIIDVHCAQELRCGQGLDDQASDVLVYQSQKYRVIYGMNYGDHGYWRVLAVAITP